MQQDKYLLGIFVLLHLQVVPFLTATFLNSLTVKKQTTKFSSANYKPPHQDVRCLQIQQIQLWYLKVGSFSFEWHNFANLVYKLSESTIYKEMRMF